MSTKNQQFWQKLNRNSYRDAVALSLYNGISDNTKFAYTTDIDEIGDVWPPATTYVFPDAAGQPIEIVSAAADTVTVKIGVISAATGLAETREATLTGTTPVTVPGGDIFAVNRAFVSGDVESIGAITIRGTGAPNSTVFAIIPVADQQTVQAPFMVPDDKVAIITNLSSSLNKTGGSDVGVVFKLVIEKPGGVPRTQNRYGLQRNGTNVFTVDFTSPTVLPPLTKVRIIADPTALVDISSFYSFILVDKDLLPPEVVTAAEEN